MVRKSIFRALIALLGFIVGTVICFAMTPFWWKLEGLVGIELAGHSGPAEWLTLSFAGLSAIAGFLLALRFGRK